MHDRSITCIEPIRSTEGQKRVCEGYLDCKQASGTVVDCMHASCTVEATQVCRHSLRMAQTASSPEGRSEEIREMIRGCMHRETFRKRADTKCASGTPTGMERRPIPQVDGPTTSGPPGAQIYFYSSMWQASSVRFPPVVGMPTTTAICVARPRSCLLGW